MKVTGPPFYDESEWEPDGLTLKEYLESLGWRQGEPLSPFYLAAIQREMIEEYGSSWRARLEIFIKQLRSSLTHTVKVFNQIHEYHEIAKPLSPPSNGPLWNPHARNGRGSRRR